ncbi:MAG: hypothetical protein VYD19_03470 [Myxococcota bacterium]|nr:hypothetical protein [Myxococcota bacterium]
MMSKNGRNPKRSVSLGYLRGQVLFLGALLIACEENKESGASATEITLSTPVSEDAGRDLFMEGRPSDQSVADQGTPLSMRIRLINPATSGPFAGVRAEAEGEESESDASGVATLTISSGPYVVTLDAPGARTHRLFGHAGEVDFEQISYLSPDMITTYVFRSLGIADNSSQGILVVGLDLPSLAPAVGARAALDVESEEGFIFAGSRPAFGTEIPEGGQGFVTFPGVPPGRRLVRAELPGGTCTLFPAGEGSEAEVEVRAGEVSILTFTCQTE